ncbi:hypothetical protein JHK86_024311 [Glycine max]|nr:hypothetical protein JHK86_024311 [Glycine max]
MKDSNRTSKEQQWRKNIEGRKEKEKEREFKILFLRIHKSTKSFTKECIRNDFAEISGKFKNGIFKISDNYTLQAASILGSKGRMSPPPHLRRSHPQDPAAMPLPVVVPFDLLPPPQVMKEKLASQNAEMQCLETENQRLAATHSVMRQELAVAQHEMQMLHGHVVALKRKREQQIRAQLEKIVKMESEAQGSESVKIELQ